MSVIDFNHTITKSKVLSAALNAVLDSTAEALNCVAEAPREYLGASAIGHDCVRKIHWDWRKPVPIAPRTERIFARGRWWEDIAAKLFIQAGFKMVRSGPALAFSQLDGKFKGHADGIIISGPEPELKYPALWEAKGLGSKGWTKLSKDGLAKAYPGYLMQCQLYMAYLDLTDNPAVFTAANMDTMEMLHLLVPFDAAVAQAASDRALQIVMGDRAGETFPRVTDDPNDWRCRYCGHRERCWA